LSSLRPLGARPRWNGASSSSAPRREIQPAAKKRQFPPLRDVPTQPYLQCSRIEKPYDDIGKTVEQLVEKSEKGDVDPNFLRAGVVKVFADGVMEYPAQTAALLCPYLDAHGKPTKSRGKLDLDPKFAQLVTKLDAAGLTVHVHAM